MADSRKLRYENPQPGDVVYFTDGFISDRRILITLCVLFERVFTFCLSPDYYAKTLDNGLAMMEKRGFTLAHAEEGKIDDPWAIVHKETAASELKRSLILFWMENDDLRDAGIILPIGIETKPEEPKSLIGLLSSDAIEGFFRAESWARTVGLLPPGKSFVDCGFFLGHRLISASSGLAFSLSQKLIPFTDHPYLFQHAATTLSHFGSNWRPDMDTLTAHLASKGILHSIPSFGAASNEEILEIREVMKDERGAYVGAMKAIISDHDLGYSPDELETRLLKVINSRIKPALADMQQKIRSERRALFRRLATTLVGGAGASVAASWFSASPNQLMLGTLSFIAKILLDVYQYQSNMEDITRVSPFKGFSFLLQLSRRLKSQQPSEKFPGAFPYGIHPEILRERQKGNYPSSSKEKVDRP